MIFQEKLIESFQLNFEKIAIETSHKSVSYRTLLTQANRISTALLRKKLVSQTAVGIIISDRIELITAIIGVANAGCVFVPLDGTLPVHRLTLMLQDLDLKYLIAEDVQVEGIFKQKFPEIEYLLLREIYEDRFDVNPMAYPTYNGSDSLYIYFTSGSTGNPKGIIGKNVSLLQFLEWEISTFGINADTKISQFISPYFDAFLRDVFAPLLAGGTICIPPNTPDILTSEHLISWIDRAGVNIIHCVPSVFRIFNDPTLTYAHFTKLKYVLMSGEKIVPASLVNWYKVFADRIQLVNLYGTTETTLIRAFYYIKPEDIDRARIPIGLPINDTKILVAKKGLEPCSILEPGELYIISNYTTKGYLNHHQLTKDRFVNINVGTAEEAVAFRTGDRARMLPNGEVELIGREDRQIKLNGIRIELDEIEQIMLQNEWVDNAVIILNESKDPTIVAFVKPTDLAPTGDLLITLLKQYLETRLPWYMVPAKVLLLNEFPHLSNGKINYKALANIRENRLVVLPVDNIENSLLTIWEEILPDRTISTDDSFLAEGGTSLGIMKLIGKVYKKFNVRITLAEIFSNLTIQQQAILIKAANKSSMLQLNSSPLKVAYHLSAVQERIYFNHELDKNNTAFNLPMIWHINGIPNKVLIEDIIRSLIWRHESLRTAFTIIDGDIMQVIKNTGTSELQEINEPSTSIKVIATHFIRPFDLNEAPLFRAALITAAEGKYIAFDIHHIICDGISQVNLLSDFINLYHKRQLQPITLTYKDYAEWEFGFRHTEEYSNLREFWLESFEGELPKIRWPLIADRQVSGSNKGGSMNFKFSAQELTEVKNTLLKDEITLSSGLFSAFFLLLTQLTGQDDIIIGINTSGRIHEEMKDVVGMFAKTLPIRCRYDVDQSFMEFLKQAHNQLVNAYSNQLYDLSNIVKDLSVARHTNDRDLFEVMFVFQNSNSNPADTDVDVFTAWEYELPVAKYPLTLFVEEGPDAYHLRWEYRDDYFYKEDISMFMEQFKELLQAIPLNLNTPLISWLGNTTVNNRFEGDADIKFNF